MDLNALRLFVAAARELSFAAVAQERDLNPSSVSRSIAQLETQLGLRLFHRTTRTMSLTEAGELYLARVAAIIDELDAAEEQARLVSTTPTGTLRLTASVAFGERVIVPLLPDFRARYPELKLELLFTDANLDLVGEGVDLALRLGPRPGGELVATRLFDTAYRVVASPDYLAGHAPIRRPADLAAHDCAVFALPAFRSAWRFRERGGGAGAAVQTVPVSAHAMVSSALSLRSIVLGGGGPALLADWLIGDDIRAGRLVDVLPAFEATAAGFDSAAWLAYASRSYLPRKVRVTVDYLKARLSPGP